MYQGLCKQLQLQNCSLDPNVSNKASRTSCTATARHLGISALQSLPDEVAHRQGLPEAAARGTQIRRIVKLRVLRSRRHETGYFVS